MATLLAAASLGAGAIVAAPAAVADEPAKIEGTTVTANPSSPTGYTVTFTYHNPDATQVRLAGDLTLRQVGGDATRYQPEAWQTGRYHAGGTEFLRDMTKDANGYWSVSVPLHAGGLSYWYRVWDPTQGWENKRIWDPASTNPRPPGDQSFRTRNNDVLDAVYVPYAEKQNDPLLKKRAEYELPAANPANRGSVHYEEYTTILGDDGHYLGIYLPAGYDPNRAEPYKVVYLSHGIFGDETDFMVPTNTPNILDNMIAKGEIEPTIAVTMGNHFTGDSLGFASYDRQNAADNLVKRILPHMETNYNVSQEREGRAYGGFSYGGMTGGFVMNSYPTTFGYYGHFSGPPSLTTQQFDDLAAAVGENGMSVFMGNGVFESSLDAMNVIAGNFRSRGIPAETAQVPGAHDGMTASQLFTIYAKDYLWANADSRDGIPIKAVIPADEEANGVLALTVADFGDAVELSEPQNSGDKLRLTGELPQITVTDSRSAEQAGQGGWAVSGQADAFRSAGQSVPASHLGWTPKVLTPRPGVSAGAPVATTLGGGNGLATAKRMASANAEGRYGSAKLGAGLALEVPVDTQPGTYTGMLTVSLFPVD
ncbi:MAG: alpha/beta hydrolase-fold protein [Demequina sp.]